MNKEHIIPTKAEKTEWRNNLYNTLLLISEDHPDLHPRKDDNLNALLHEFFYYADTYNDGYFSEKDEADTDRYCAWLVQEYSAHTH